MKLSFAAMSNWYLRLLVTQGRWLHGVLFQHRFISKATKDKVNELNETREYKARLLVDDIENKIKSFPDSFEKFITILREADVRYTDLIEALEQERIKIGYQDQSTMTPEPLEPELTEDTITGPFHGGIEDPLLHPPNSADVGRELRVYANSPRRIPSVDSLEGKILQIFQTGEHTEALKLLSQAQSQAVDLRCVCDLDGKTLLHLACRKSYLNWYQVIQCLVEKHNCDVSAVDEDGNTPLHDAYQCGNHKVVEYLLSLPTCNPDAVNKHEYTVLRMALQINDIPTTRALLATGRVDPRRGSPRGHPYKELIEMDGTMPQNSNDSALEIVTKCAECIEKSSTTHSNFSVYYLLNILTSIFKNRDQISIGELVDCIKENNIALPKKPAEIHNLLIGLSCDFEVCGEETGNEYERYDIQRKGHKAQRHTQQFASPQSMPSPVNDSRFDNDTNSDNYGRDTAPLIEVPRTKKPSLQQYITNQGIAALQNNGRKCIYITVCSCFAFWIIFVFVLGVCGAALYNPFNLVSSTNVAQIQRHSVPLIGKLDMNNGNLLQLRVLGSDALPISFYTLQQCSAQDSFVTKHISETETVGLNSSVESRRVTEWYFTGNTTVNTIITTQILLNYPINFCLAFLVIFDSVDKFNDFIQTPSLEEENYLFTECIANIHSQTSTFFFDKESYYFVGLYSEIPTEVGTFTVEFFGSYLEYKFSNSELICSLNSLNNTACQFSPIRDSLIENACIVGFIPEANTVQSQVKGAAVKLETAALSESTADVYFFIPFILCGTLTVVALLLFCMWWVCHQY